MKTRIVIPVLLIGMIIGAVFGVLFNFVFLKLEKSEDDLIKEFYLTETAVHVSPHHLRKAIDKGDDSFILVDLRSEEEYEKEHIIEAINIPAYRDPDTSAYDDVERIISMFSALPKDKDIIVYCYSTPCMSGRKIGKLLTEHGIYVKHLGIGWNEWRYYWNLWNHEHEWNQTNVSDYIETGESPKIKINKDKCVVGEYGC